MSVKSFDLGKVARSMDLLGVTGVNNSHVQATIDDPIRRAVVGSAYRGDLVAEKVSFDDILCRENNINGIICEWAGMKFPGADVIEKALRQAEEASNGLTVHDRFIPNGFGLPQIFEAIYGFNEFCKKERNNPGFKLYNEMKKEWWRSDKSVQHLPTEAQVIRLDFREIMAPTDMSGAPFNLAQPDQEKWAEPDGLTSAEELSLLQLRSGFEYGRPLWVYGWARCRNACGSGYSLRVYFLADDGFRVDYYDRVASYTGAVRRKSLVLVP